MKVVNWFRGFVILLVASPLLQDSRLTTANDLAMRFDGANDYVDFGNVYDNIHLPITFSAWILLDPTNISVSPVFASRNCFEGYAGFWVVVDNKLLKVEYGDGYGGNSPRFRRGKMAIVPDLTKKWNHIAAVIEDPNNVKLYVNGQEVAGEYTGDSMHPMSSTVNKGHASAASFYSNDITYRYKGDIDEIRIWNRALTGAEIASTMSSCLAKNEAGLIGHWDFNETSGATVRDKSRNNFHGTIVGKPVRIKSGALLNKQ